MVWVEVLHSRLTGPLRGLADKLILLICLLVAATVSVLAGLLLVEAISRGEIEIRSLEMPRALLFAPLMLGFGLMTCEFLRMLVRGEAVTDQDFERETL